jgi:hypothetical protein
MPISFTIDHEKRLVHARTYGVMTIAHLEDYLDQVVVQGAMPYAKLYDNREGTFEYDDKDMMLAGARISAYAALEPRGPVAVIAVTDASIEVAKRVLNLGGARRPGKIFHTEAAARKWLAEQPEA